MNTALIAVGYAVRIFSKVGTANEGVPNKRIAFVVCIVREVIVSS